MNKSIPDNKLDNCGNLSNTNELVDIVQRQTDYDRDTALLKLQEEEFDPIAVIRKYMNPDKKVFIEKAPPATTNQRMYKEIRTMLDTANATYRAKKEAEESNE